MRLLAAVIAIGLSGAGVAACGASDQGTRTAARVDSTGSTSNSAAATTASSTAATRRYLNDSDNDPSTDEDPDDREGNKTDYDNDYPEDHKQPENDKYVDSDDEIAVYGPSASAADKRAIAVIVKRYYRVAAAGDGAKACAMMYTVLSDVVPEDFGSAYGPSYMRGKTCPVVMSRLFKHSHAKLVAQLRGTLEVADVRIKDNRAFVLLGSTTMPASELFVHREHGVWKIDSMLGGPLI
jgi:hypothetical protein